MTIMRGPSLFMLLAFLPFRAGAEGVIAIAAESLLQGALERSIVLRDGGMTPSVTGSNRLDLQLLDEGDLLLVDVSTGDVCLADIVVSFDIDELSTRACGGELFDPESEQFLTLSEFSRVHKLPGETTCVDTLAVSGAFIYLPDSPFLGCPTFPVRIPSTPPFIPPPPVPTDPPRDSDGDGVPDPIDNCPTIANADQTNSDGDTAGDACDTDDDNDGMPDAFETANGLDPLNPADASGDLDRDGFTNLQEFKAGTDPNDPASNAATAILPTLQMLLEE